MKSVIVHPLVAMVLTVTPLVSADAGPDPRSTFATINLSSANGDCVNQFLFDAQACLGLEERVACIVNAAQTLRACRLGIPTQPELVYPLNNEAIIQNDPTIGCPAHPTIGYGFQILFDWTDSRSPQGIAGYHVYAKHRDALYPIVDTFVASSNLTVRDCNSFVIDRNLYNWEWHVQAEDLLGGLSAQSNIGVFTFAPCRLADGTTPCYALP